MKFLPALLDLLFPPRCAFCGALTAPGDQKELCAQCAPLLPCIPREKQTLLGDSYSLCITPFYYQHPVDHSIRRYKFHGKSWQSRAYGPFLREALEFHLTEPPDLITWAPLSPLRLWRRGYDQSRLLAIEAGVLWGTPPQRLLVKTRNTRPQSKRTKSDRQTLARGLYRAVSGPDLSGKRILLVDDVLTTGATLSACASALLEAGAEEVLCLTLARSISAVDRL